jgi:hypothetical protein
MKPHLPIIILGLAITMQVAAGDRLPVTPTNAPARITLRDQFDVPHTLAFPATNLTFLTIADKTGSQQIAAWVTPISQHFGARIAIAGIADVSAVPRPLRGLVRKSFQKDLAHPVLLDWSGDTVKAFAALPHQANLYVLDPEGRIVKHLSGAATAEAVQGVCEAMEQALAAAAKRVASR